jgi:hypothetical protein
VHVSLLDGWIEIPDDEAHLRLVSVFRILHDIWGQFGSRMTRAERETRVNAPEQTAFDLISINALGRSDHALNKRGETRDLHDCVSLELPMQRPAAVVAQ